MVSLGQKIDPKKAEKLFEKARYAFDAGDYKAALKDLGQALEEDSTYSDAYILTGDILVETGDPEGAVENYRNALKFDPASPSIVWNLLGNSLFSLERYREACPCFDSVLSYPEIRPDLRQTIESRLSLCLFRRELMENRVEFSPVNLGNGINTPDDEYINGISADGQMLYFTRKEPTNEIKGKEFIENFFFSTWRDGRWDSAVLLGYPEGTENDAGALCISPDGRLVIFTSCFRKDGFGSCDLYYSEKIEDRWTTPRNMGVHINSDLWDAQPSLSSDGRTLFFASNRKGGYGSSDIWASTRMPGGGWGKPFNLGAVINTREADMAPFIHYDNQTLYFSSKGHPGQGGVDLFLSERKDGRWQAPQNLGYPINTKDDELLVIVNPDGETGFISSNSLEGEGGYDIFSFKLHSGIIPVPVTYMKGVVYDSDDRQPLEARFELIDLTIDSAVITSNSNPVNGEFLVCLPVGRNYALNVSCPGYLFHSENFPLQELKVKTDPFVKDIPMKKVAPGNIMVLNNIFFRTDHYTLEPESYPELDKLAGFLAENPGLHVEISGHTDNVGSDDYNLQLSGKRAGSVYDYLVGKGIDVGRMAYKGYGESLPVASNDDEAGRAKNRRTEMKILESR